MDFTPPPARDDGRPRPPVVLVHGNPETAAVWNPVIEALNRDDVYTLSPPGFGAPLSSRFPATVTGYRDWLMSQLAAFERPVDLVGHDWGGAHGVQVAMHSPGLIRSWISDELQLFAPGYEWHQLARVWQQDGAGEALVAEQFCGTFAQRMAVVAQMGITGTAAERVAAGRLRRPTGAGGTLASAVGSPAGDVQCGQESRPSPPAAWPRVNRHR